MAGWRRTCAAPHRQIHPTTGDFSKSDFYGPFFYCRTPGRERVAKTTHRCECLGKKGWRKVKRLYADKTGDKSWKVGKGERFIVLRSVWMVQISDQRKAE